MSQHRTDDAKRNNGHHDQRLPIGSKLHGEQDVHGNQCDEQADAKALHAFFILFLLTFPANTNGGILLQQLRNESRAEVGNNAFGVPAGFIKIRGNRDGAFLVDAVDL